MRTSGLLQCQGKSAPDHFPFAQSSEVVAHCIVRGPPSSVCVRASIVTIPLLGGTGLSLPQSSLGRLWEMAGLVCSGGTSQRPSGSVCVFEEREWGGITTGIESKGELENQVSKSYSTQSRKHLWDHSMPLFYEKPRTQSIGYQGTVLGRKG